MARIVFFSIEDWEKEYLSAHLKDHEVVYDENELTESNAAKYADFDILGVFIFSEVKEAVLKKLTNAKLITTMSTGFDHINLEHCDKKGIVVCNVPTYGENTVAEHAMALLLATSRKIVQSVDRTRKGDFSLDDLRGFDLKDKTIGIIGTGNIGRHLAHYASAFGMKVIAFDKFPNEAHAKECGYTYVPFDQLLGESEVISLHVPLLEETKHMINKDNIRKIKKGCVLINTARGGLIETEALLIGLKEGILGACGLDVLEEEHAIREEKELLHEAFKKECDLKILLEDHFLLEHDNVIITPHNAFNSKEALSRILDTTIDNIQSFLSGVPKNVVKKKD